MTHFAAYTNVLIPKENISKITEKDLLKTIDEMFAPYYEQTDNPQYLETVKDEKYGDYKHNPNAKWDWYVIGGRFDGIFDNKKNITTYLDGNLVTAKDLYDYTLTSLTQTEEVSREFLDEYKNIVDRFGKIPPLPNYRDVTDEKITEEEFYQKQQEVRDSKSFQETMDLVKRINDKVEEVSGINPGYFEFFSSIATDLVRQITLNDDQKDFQTCVNLLEWFTPIAYVNNENWYERGNVGWFGYVGQDNREEKKWVYEYVDLIKQSAERSTEDEKSCIVMIDVHI